MSAGSSKTSYTSQSKDQLQAASRHYSAGNRPGIDGDLKRDCFSKAEQLLADILKQSPEHSQALGLLGRIRLDMRSLEQARELFTQSVRLSPEDPQLLCNLGYLALIEQRFGDAEGQFRKALSIDSHDPSAFLGVAHVLAGQERFDQAYMHYRRLIELGYSWPSIFAGIMHCCEHLAISEYNPMIAEDLIYLIGHEQILPQRLATLIADIIEHRYAALPADVELVDFAVADELLISALQCCTLPSTEIESLLVYLRTSIFNEISSQGALTEAMQPLAIALATAQVRNGGLLAATANERSALDILHQQIARVASARDQEPAVIAEDLAGACIVVAMFDSIWRQPYSLLLAALEVSDWPLQVRDLMEQGFYSLMADENHKQQFSEKRGELLLAAEDLPLPYPVWEKLPTQEESRLGEALNERFGIRIQARDVMVAIIGSASDPQTLAFAKSFTDSTVLVIDYDLCDLAYGARKAREHEITNVAFWPMSMFSAYIEDGHRFHFIRVDQLSSSHETNAALPALLREGLDADGLMNIRLNQAHAAAKLLPKTMSASEQPGYAELQQLRFECLQQIQGGQLQALSRSPDFYSLHGFRKLLRSRSIFTALPELLPRLASEVHWKAIEAQNTTGHATHRQGCASAWQRMMELDWHCSSGASWYFRKR